MKPYLTYLILIVLTATGCISNKKVVYLQGPESGTFTNEAFVQQYQIRPNDLLQVRVNSLFPEANELLNQVMQMQQGNMNMGVQGGNGFFYLMGFTVNDSGYVKLPMVGKVMAQGLTTDQLEERLEDRFEEFYEGISVIVKVSGIQFSMLGEFRQPGQFLVFDNNLSILEAIAMAGDMTDFANRREVQLLRTKGNNMYKYTIDMTSMDMLTDSLFYLQRDDVLYAPPLRGEQYGFKRDGFVYTLAILSLISNLFLIYNLVNSL